MCYTRFYSLRTLKAGTQRDVVVTSGQQPPLSWVITEFFTLHFMGSQRLEGHYW